VLTAKIILNRTYLKDCLGLCDFAWPMMYSFNTANHVGDPELEGKIFSAVTGIPSDRLDRYAEVLFNLQRAILIREGRKTPEADYPLEYNFTEPLQIDHFGRPLIIPGGDCEVVNAIGKILDRDKFMRLLKEFYQLRGWDEDTGIPKKETLKALGLGDVACELELK
jgi:aldehyde:ferredoxin oxidoreductase